MALKGKKGESEAHPAPAANRQGRTLLKGSNPWGDVLGKGERREEQPGEA